VSEPVGPGPSQCPDCASRDVRRIVYGTPLPELIEEAEASHVELGGCIVGPDDPDSRRRSNGMAWKRSHADRERFIIGYERES
jgi:hypothetical protein